MQFVFYTDDKKAFTLIELLVAIAIIAILAVVGITIFSNVQKGARDAKRKADIEVISTAAELHYTSGTGQYPDTATYYSSIGNSWFANGNKPKDPLTNTDYTYQTSSGNTGFQVCATLEDTTSFCGGSAQGKYTASIPPPPGPPPPPPGCVPGLPESVNDGYGTYKSAQSPNSVFPCSGWRPYADSAIFNQPVPATPTININSSAIVNAWFTRVPADISIGLSTSTSAYKDWSHPIYFSQPGDPLYTITCTKYGGACEISGAQIRIPVGAKPANGGDGHMAIIEQSTNTEYDFWQAAMPSGTGGPLSISWGGKTDITIDGLNSDSTAAAFGGAAGMVRGVEWSEGVIDHALFITIQCDNGQIIYGGHGTKCGTTSATLTENPATAPPMGARFYLAMTDSEINAIVGLASWKKILMKAMAHYGMYFGDTGGSSTWEIKPESGFSYTSFGYTDPLRTFASANCSPYSDFWLCKFPEMPTYANKIFMIDP